MEIQKALVDKIFVHDFRLDDVVIMKFGKMCKIRFRSHVVKLV